LTIVARRNTVVQIVPPDIIKIGNTNIDARVIQGREETSHDDVDENEERVRFVAEELVAHVADDEE
jgi:hypothetical protein